MSETNPSPKADESVRLSLDLARSRYIPSRQITHVLAQSRSSASGSSDEQMLQEVLEHCGPYPKARSCVNLMVRHYLPAQFHRELFYLLLSLETEKEVERIAQRTMGRLQKGWFAETALRLVPIKGSFTAIGYDQHSNQFVPLKRPAHLYPRRYATGERATHVVSWAAYEEYLKWFSIDRLRKMPLAIADNRMLIFAAPFGRLRERRMPQVYSRTMRLYYSNHEINRPREGRAL